MSASVDKSSKELDCSVLPALSQVHSHSQTQPPRQKSRDTQPEQSFDRFRLGIIIFSLCLVQFLSALDITIVSTALPTIARQQNASAAQYTWVSSSYTLASTASTPLWARCSDIWGRKPLLMIANLVFMAGSLTTGLSQSVDVLISGRTLQGLGGGGISITCQLIIADMFSMKVRAKYYGFSALVWAVASGFGPILGGVFTQTIGWRWCCKFLVSPVTVLYQWQLLILECKVFINLPLDAISLVLLFFTLKLNTTRITVAAGLKSFDWIGSVLIVGGTICFLCGLEGGASSIHDWKSAYTLGLILSGLAMVAFFVVYEWRFAKLPLVSMRVFVGRSKVAALATAFTHTFVFISYDFFLPLYFQVVLGASPIHSGLYLLVLILPLSVMASATGIFIKRTGKYRLATWVGSTFMTLGTGLFICFDSRTVWSKIIIFQLIAGIGAGPVFLSPMIALQNHLQPEDISPGTAAFTFIRSMASSISIVCGGVVLQKGLGGEQLTMSNTLGTTTGETIATQARHYMSGLSKLWIFYTAISGVMLLSSSLIGEKPLGNSVVGSPRDL